MHVDPPSTKETSVPKLSPEHAYVKSWLVNGEQVQETLEGDENGLFVLTDQRILYIRSNEFGGRWSSAFLSSANGAELSTRTRDRSQLIWAVFGLIAAVAVWQISTSEVVGIVGGAILAVLAIALAVDHWLTDPGSNLVFKVQGDNIGGSVPSSAGELATQFITKFYELRHTGRWDSWRTGKPFVSATERYPSPKRARVA